MNHEPKLFIDIGETGAFFTLRETYLHPVPGPGNYGNAVVNGVYQGSYEERSYHHFNLSQDPDKAYEKAVGVAQELGLRLATTRESLLDELREIQRATAEQLQQREQRMREQREQWDRERAERRFQQVALLQQDHIVSFGRYEGTAIRALPRGYATWVVATSDRLEFEEDSLMELLASVVRKHYPEMLLPKPDPAAIVGEPKQRLEFNVTVTSVREFTRDSFSGFGVEVVRVTTMVDRATGACLVCFSTSWSGEEGADMRIKATVKKHDEYKGQAQTVIQRIKVQK